jgi:hypothetical protein
MATENNLGQRPILFGAVKEIRRLGVTVFLAKFIYPLCVSTFSHSESKLPLYSLFPVRYRIYLSKEELLIS